MTSFTALSLVGDSDVEGTLLLEDPIAECRSTFLEPGINISGDRTASLECVVDGLEIFVKCRVEFCGHDVLFSEDGLRKSIGIFQEILIRRLLPMATQSGSGRPDPVCEQKTKPGPTIP